MKSIAEYAISALVVLLALTIHEFSHGYAAYKLGDPTAKNYGRLTLTPIKHLDPLGAVCMVIFRVGWAKPVPINPRYFKNPKRDFAISAVAGPVSNLALAFVSAFLYLFTYAILKDATFSSNFTLALAQNTLLFIWLLHIINLSLAIFNILPIPPFDGSRILYAILPQRIYFKIMQNEKRIYYAILIWLFAGDILARGLLSLPFASGNPIFEFMASILSLSGLLSSATAFISGLMTDFWQLIPFLKI